MKSPLREESAWIDELTPAEFEEYERRYKWVAEDARPEQLTPEGDWKTWLLLAGRRFGKTRAAAEDVGWYGLMHPKSHIAVVAETFADGRDVCIEGESGLLEVLPYSSVRHWNRSIGELFLHNGTKYKLFSGDKPRGLRGHGHDRAWTDELAKFEYPQETWDQLQFGLSAGENPQNIVTTTPRPIPLIQDLVERENVVITSGSTFDNAENLTDSFLDEVRLRYEGTKLGEQELFGKIVELDGEAAFKREWFHLKNRYDSTDPKISRLAYGRFFAWDTANKADEDNAYTVGVVGEITRDYRLLIRDVIRGRKTFDALPDWVVRELKPHARDLKLKGGWVEDAASGVQLLQVLGRTGPAWLRNIIWPSKPKGSKEERWGAAALWCRRDCVLLPHPHESVPWLAEFEDELFSIEPRFKDQRDAFAELINEIEANFGVLSQGWVGRRMKSKAS